MAIRRESKLISGIILKSPHRELSFDILHDIVSTTLINYFFLNSKKSKFERQQKSAPPKIGEDTPKKSFGPGKRIDAKTALDMIMNDI